MNQCQFQISWQRGSHDCRFIPCQCQEKLFARPTGPDASDAPIVQHQVTSAACSRLPLALRSHRVPVKSAVTGTIISAIEGPDSSVAPGALQLDSVKVPSARREDASPFQTVVARGQAELRPLPPLGDSICFLSRDGQALDIL
jgi:hypothetical protein